MPQSIKSYLLATTRIISLLLLPFAIYSTALLAQSKASEKKPDETAAPKPDESQTQGNRPRIAKPKAKLVATISDSELRKELDEKENNKTKPVSKTAAITVTSLSVTEALERKILEITNKNRADNGLPPLAWSEDMARVARVHSDNMARFDFFNHVGLDGKLVSDRADDLGFGKWRSIGENIAFNQGYDDPVEQACMRWMQSPSHRENILNKKWKEVGIGVAITQDGKYYFTQVFVLR